MTLADFAHKMLGYHPMCPAQVQWGRLAAAQHPTAPDAQGAGESGTLGCNSEKYDKKYLAGSIGKKQVPNRGTLPASRK